MSLIDRFLNAIKLNDDFDDEEDFLDEDDDLEEESASSEKPRNRFFSRFTMDDEEDEDDEDYDEYEEPRPVRKSSTASSSKSSAKSSRTATSSGSAGKSSTSGYAASESSARRVTYASSSSSSASKKAAERTKSRSKTPVRRKGSLPMEVNVVRPSSMEDTREIADNLMDECTVVLNLEGLDVDIAQRVIDFTCGVCYSLNGNLQKISSYIFILTPQGVDISGDFQSILDGAFDIPSMRGLY